MNTLSRTTVSAEKTDPNDRGISAERDRSQEKLDLQQSAIFHLPAPFLSASPWGEGRGEGERSRWPLASLLTGRSLIKNLTCATLLCISLTAQAAKGPLALDAKKPEYNLQTHHGVPISNNPADRGSNGKAPSVAQQAGLGLTTDNPSAGQFAGATIWGATEATENSARYPSGAVNKPSALNTDGTVAIQVSRAWIGAPFFGRRTSFDFGATIAAPSSDENNQPLSVGVRASDYWAIRPFLASGKQDTDSGYYYSENANKVFAVQSGPISVVWRKFKPEATTPADAGNTNKWAQIGSQYYRLHRKDYVVSSSPIKAARKIYWTKGIFSGPPVSVPGNKIGAVKVVYNNNLPERVAKEFVAPGQTFVEPNATNRLEETRTLWFEPQQGQIHAYNKEGRVFVELLGDKKASGTARVHLGFEIVDVIKEPTPADVSVDLGDQLTAWQDRRDDTHLVPSPVIQASALDFYYRHVREGIDRPTLYATRRTDNLNDVLVHWLEEGIESIKWPSRFVRYQLVWPTEVGRYRHYVRAAVASESEAQTTAVQLPTDNVPIIQFQDALDRPRAKLTHDFRFYTYLTAAHPAHRTLIRYTSGDEVAFERVFSWLDQNLRNHLSAGGKIAYDGFSGGVVEDLKQWIPGMNRLLIDRIAFSPRIIVKDVEVGQRITAPIGEIGADPKSDYWAGFINQDVGTSFNVNAYKNPFALSFEAANKGSIIPVNVVPGKDQLEIWWFRKSPADAQKGFKPVYWPSVLGVYNLKWPSKPKEIVLASNQGSGALDSVSAKGTIYHQNDPAKAGYNPNEEHSVLIGGTLYALRDDLNITSGVGYSSEPYALLEFADTDKRPSMAVFKVLREKASKGVIFDYVVEAGKILQAPMPLPLMAKPIEGFGQRAKNYNTEPLHAQGDYPVNWSDATHAGKGRDHYRRFTYKDRKGAHWIYRGTHRNQLPPLKVGFYPDAQGYGDVPFLDPLSLLVQPGYTTTTHLHTSRRPSTLTVKVDSSTPLPSWVEHDHLKFTAAPDQSVSPTPGPTMITLVVTSSEDGATLKVQFPIHCKSWTSGQGQKPMEVWTDYDGQPGDELYVGRPPYLTGLTNRNHFSMRYYYKTQKSFAFPGHASAPAVGSIVPYLRPIDAVGNPVGDGSSKNTASLDIIYRPVWPAKVPELRMGETLTTPKFGLPAVRGQSSLEIAYQQSIATNILHADASTTLHDATREKEYDIEKQSLEKLPGGILTDSYQGKTYFPQLPPHISRRLFFDPNRGAKGHLVLRGEFKDEALGEKYVHLNVLLGKDLKAAKDLCPAADKDKAKWDNAIDGLATTVETFHENPNKPGEYIPDPNRDLIVPVGKLADITDDNQAVDSYALAANGPGSGYVTLIAGNGEAFTPEAEPVSMHIIKVTKPLYDGEVKIIPSANPLDEKITFQHTADLAGKFDEFEYEWLIAPPVDGDPPVVDSSMSKWNKLVNGKGLPRHTLGGQGIDTLIDNYVVVRYRPVNPRHPLYHTWSKWTKPQLAEGWIKRVLAGINPFNQRVKDLFNNQVNTTVSLVSQAGGRWEGDVALNLANINDFGLIEIYETVLNRGKDLSINAPVGVNFGPANDALLLAAGYINDLYMIHGNEAWADAANPTIGIGTDDGTYGDVATSLFSFKGQVPSLLEEELALLRGRDDYLHPGVETRPVYNRLVWNYTRGINAGEVVYALNYNISEDEAKGVNGVINADDARRMYPQGHGDAYGHYLTALKGYYKLLVDEHFTWVPRTEAVTVLGQPVSVDYLDERKFAAAAAAVARTGKQIFDLTWRRDYKSGGAQGWDHFANTRTNTRRTYLSGSKKVNPVRHWGIDHWATRVGIGTYVNWAVGNAMLPDIDADPTHEGIKRIDRTTVPELKELATISDALMTSMDNAESGLNPLGLPDDSVVFDIDPSAVASLNPATRSSHFEQVYDRAVKTLRNAVTSFDDAKGVTQLMRREEDSQSDFQADVAAQELSYKHELIELYGSPYPSDVGPGKTYKQGYNGPDLLHYMYVDNKEIEVPDIVEASQDSTFSIDVQNLPDNWPGRIKDHFTIVQSMDGTNPGYTQGKHYVEYTLDSHGFFKKLTTWKGKRGTPGKIQDAISKVIQSRNLALQALDDQEGLKWQLDREIELFQATDSTRRYVRGQREILNTLETTLDSVKFANEMATEFIDMVQSTTDSFTEATKEAFPQNMVFGLASGGDLMAPARAGVDFASAGKDAAFNVAKFIKSFALAGLEFSTSESTRWIEFDRIDPAERTLEKIESVYGLDMSLDALQDNLFVVNQRLQQLDDAYRAYRSLVAEGDRIQKEREIFRQRTAANTQQFRTRDAGFRFFRNEKLERYKSLFDLAARYSFLAAKAYDYETGLLHTDTGRGFVDRMIQSRALGVVRNGAPQFAGSTTLGDAGLSSALAEMKADWDVLKGRLGFNNPDTYSTTASLRSENFRILPGSSGANKWQDLLEKARRDNVLADADVKRYCMQIDQGDGLPVPGLVIEFSTVIADGLNLFGRPLAAGDHAFSPSSFATKLFSVGIAFEGYKGMDNPNTISSAVSKSGAQSPSAPSISFLDGDAMSANPFIYLVPVGVDSMRNPPLGDTTTVRTWKIQDVALPLPFNIGQSDLSTKALWQSADSLTEQLFTIRKHQAFRPVSTTGVFSQNGQLTPTGYTNNRLIGRSVWNSKWKLVIPGRTLLANSEEGLDRFIRTVTDIKIHLETYSYAGN